MRHFHLLIALTLTLAPFATAPAATIDLPRTGQTRCSDENGAKRPCANTGEDGEYQAGAAWPNPRFTPVANGQCISDNLTGLMWTQDAKVSGDVTWEQGLSFVNDLRRCGYDDWRMPNRKEMLSLLINFSVEFVHLWLVDQGFVNVQVDISDYYWTSTTSPAYGGAMYATSYGSLSTSEHVNNKAGLPGGSSISVWPVRGGR